MAENTVVSARRRRGILRGRLTCIERDTVALEGKAELTHQDGRKVERLLDQLKENDSSFELRHLEVLNFIEAEDEETLAQEEAVFDEHVNRVAELTGRLELLDIPEREAPVLSPMTITTPKPSGTLVKQLKYIEQQREEIAMAMRSPPSGTEEHLKLWLQRGQKEIGALSVQLTLSLIHI